MFINRLPSAVDDHRELISSCMCEIFISKRKRGKKDSVERTIGFENVVVGTMTHKLMFVTPILVRVMLGKDLKNVTDNEKMRHVPSNDVVHVASTE